jgi:hypothetical protein
VAGVAAAVRRLLLAGPVSKFRRTAITALIAVTLIMAVAAPPANAKPRVKSAGR